MVVQTRRGFLKASLMATTMVGSMSAFAGEAKLSSEKSKPAALRAGMTVGLVAPGTNASDNDGIQYAIEILQSLGFRVKQGAHLYQRRGYFAGTDAQRAGDLNKMFADDEVEAILCLRGGFGSIHLLDLLDYDVIAANPKILLGYSDITALLNAIHKKTGMTTYHGPIARQSYSDYTLAEYKKVLFEGGKGQLIGAPPTFETRPGKVESENRIVTYVPGKVKGPLVGGNLTVFSDLLGTPYFPDLRGAILFLEDIREQPYRIDAMLTRLHLSGSLDQCAGFALGKFTDCKPDNPPTRSLQEIFEERFKPLNKPCFQGLMCGHVKDQTVMPIGCKVEMDGDSGALRLLENAVTLS